MANTSRVHFWTDEETEYMLTQLKELNILKYMDGRKTRNGDLFKKVAEHMVGAGFKRTPEQVRVRWKHLKQAHYNAKKSNSTSGHSPVSCPFLEILEELLGRRPLSQAVQHGVDVGLSTPVSDSPTKIEKEEEHASPRRPIRHKRPRKEFDPFKRELMAALLQPQPPPPPPSEDELFLRSLLPSLERMPLALRQEVKLDIHKIIFEASQTCIKREND
ncbi:uncharacterized protein LOC130111976 [Lampris incognitus]|uniref:uncharacterized protein LOC130111976 n=1 Tax=Lampris incognitus TaxID=2546036 RepID=UPI0024B57BDA|nr:uncharacterized protein LOC130111976 [Lampris incognitus]